MKAVLKFTLPEDNERFAVASKAQNLYFTLVDFHNWIRNEGKHQEHTEEEYKLIDKIHEKFFEIMNDNDVNLEMMS